MRHVTQAALGLVALLLAGAAHAGPLQDWNGAMLAAIRVTQVPPPMAARQLAILNTAMFEAVNNATGQHYAGYQPVKPSAQPLIAAKPPGPADPEAAAAGAALSVLGSLYGNVIARTPALTAQVAGLRDRWPASPAHPEIAAGLVLGRRAAERMVALRADDNALDMPPPYLGAAELGRWRPTPPGYFPGLLPHWARVTPWVMTSAAQFRPPGPPALSSYVWVDQFNASKSVGSVSGASNSPERREIALFWSDDAGTETPPGHWMHIAGDVAQAQQLTLIQTARLLAMLAVTEADAAILVWDAKYWFSTWRPITAIRNPAGANPRVAADPDWKPLLVTPAFPEYVSGDSTFGGAAACILARFFGTDSIGFDTATEAVELPGVVHHFDSFSDAAEEAGLSRIYGGIHFYFSHTDGAAAGRRLGDYAFGTLFKPKS